MKSLKELLLKEQISGKRFIDNGNKTITDNKTKLMWQKKTSEEMTFKDAEKYAEGLRLAGYSDWRLPNLIELRSLVDKTRRRPSIVINYFPDTRNDWYWSSLIIKDRYAMVMGFDDRRVTPLDKFAVACVRCVRPV